MFDLLQKIKKLEYKSTSVLIEQSHKMSYEEESVKSYKNEKVDLLGLDYVIFYICN